MPPSPIRPHIPQPLDVVHDLAAQIILYRHRAELGCDIVDLLVVEAADFGGLVHVEFGHQPRAHVGSDAVEGLEGFGDETAFVESDAEDEDLPGFSDLMAYLPL